MFAVQIEWRGEWASLPFLFHTQDDAEWAIAEWRQDNGSNGKDTGFRVVLVRD